MPQEVTADLLQSYGIRLTRARESGEYDAGEIADLVMQLPAGARVWAAVGGWAALTVEARQVQVVEYQMRAIWHAYTGGKGKRPKPPEAPKGWLVEQQEKQRKAAQWADRAAAWRAHYAEHREEMQRRAAEFRLKPDTQHEQK